MELMKSLVEQKKQLEETKLHLKEKIDKQNAENDKLEKQVVELQVQIKTEELINELNTMKAANKTDVFI